MKPLPVCTTTELNKGSSDASGDPQGWQGDPECRKLSTLNKKRCALRPSRARPRVGSVRWPRCLQSTPEVSEKLIKGRGSQVGQSDSLDGQLIGPIRFNKPPHFTPEQCPVERLFDTTGLNLARAWALHMRLQTCPAPVKSTVIVPSSRNGRSSAATPRPPTPGAPSPEVS